MASDIDRLLEYLRDRALFERRETSDFDRDRLDRLRDHFDAFSGEYFDGLFEIWKRSGESGVRRKLATVKVPCGRISWHRLERDYAITGRIAEAS
jgi:hypothetical protein